MVFGLINNNEITTTMITKKQADFALRICCSEEGTRTEMQAPCTLDCGVTAATDGRILLLLNNASIDNPTTYKCGNRKYPDVMAVDTDCERNRSIGFELIDIIDKFDFRIFERYYRNATMKRASVVMYSLGVVLAPIGVSKDGFLVFDFGEIGKMVVAPLNGSCHAEEPILWKDATLLIASSEDGKAYIDKYLDEKKAEQEEANRLKIFHVPFCRTQCSYIYVEARNEEEAARIAKGHGNDCNWDFESDYYGIEMEYDGIHEIDYDKSDERHNVICKDNIKNPAYGTQAWALQSRNDTETEA